jgi:hypothetical protein
VKRLLAAQADLWCAQESESSFAASCIDEYLDIPGPIDAALFAAAARRVVEEFPVLRMGFRRRDGEAIPLVHPPWNPLSGVCDVSDHADPQAAMVEIVGQAATRPFDLDGPLLAYRLFRLSGERFVWHTRYHPMLTDGVGCWMTAKRLSDIYNASLERREPPAVTPVSPQMLLDDEERYVASGRQAGDRAFWSHYLDGFQPGAGFPKHPRADAGPPIRKSAVMDREAAGAVLAVAGRLNVPLAAVLIGAVFLYLHRLTAERDLLLGLVVAARDGLWRRTPARSMNVVPLRASIEPAATLSEVARLVSGRLLQEKRRWRYRGADLKQAAYATHGIDPRRPSINVMAINEITFGGSAATVHAMTPDNPSELNIRYYVSERRIAIDLVAPSSLYGADDLQKYARGLHRLFEEETSRLLV